MIPICEKAGTGRGVLVGVAVGEAVFVGVLVAVAIGCRVYVGVAWRVGFAVGVLVETGVLLLIPAEGTGWFGELQEQKNSRPAKKNHGMK